MMRKEPSRPKPFVRNLCKAAVGLLLVLLACGFFYLATTNSDEEVIHFIEPTANNTYIYDSITGEELYLSDSAMAVREAQAEKLREENMKMYERKMNEIIKRREERASEGNSFSESSSSDRR